jgi:Transposase
MPVSQVSVSLSAAEGAGVLALLFPYLGAVAVDRAEIRPGLVSIWVHAAADGAACPGCGTWCTAVRDRYLRRLRDAGAGGRRVLVWLVARLLRCGNPDCPRGSFAEQPEGLAVPYARTTPLLAGQLAAVAAALCGRAGSRLARAVLAVEVSRHTLIRVLAALPAPAAGPVRVLGIDDFSLRKGCAYATLLVDMETGLPVDVLPDREAGTAAGWLKAHPEVEVICRDRGGAYAEAARDGAPHAIQVADRWHIWHNLCRYAGQAVARHRDCLAGSGCARQDRAEGHQQDQEPGGLPAAPEAVIRARHAAVHELRAAGKTLDEAAGALGLSRQLAGRFWRAGTADTLLQAAGTPGLDPYKPHLRRPCTGRSPPWATPAASAPPTGGWPGSGSPPRRNHPPRPPGSRSPGGCSPTPGTWTATSRRSCPPSSAAAPNCRTWPGTSPDSPRSSPAATATASTAGSPPPATAPPSSRSSPASAATTRPSATP